jgi:hypothetical protein
MGESWRRMSEMRKEQVRSTGPRTIFGWGRVAIRARMERRSKPEAE